MTIRQTAAAITAAITITLDLAPSAHATSIAPQPGPTTRVMQQSMRPDAVTEQRHSTPGHITAEDPTLAAIELSRRTWRPGQARIVYITRADVLADALAAGSLQDGPLLYLPSGGSLSGRDLQIEIERLAPEWIIALGGEAAVPQASLDSLAQGRQTWRLGGASRYETAVAISQWRYRDAKAARNVYLTSATVFADAAVAGQIANGPILPVAPSGKLHPAVAGELRRLKAVNTVALGGRAAVSDRALRAAAGGRGSARIDGANRYETAASMAEMLTRQWTASGSMYLADGRSPAGLATALAASGRTVGNAPVVLVADGATRDAEALSRRLSPSQVIALGSVSRQSEEAVRAQSSRAWAPRRTIDADVQWCDAVVARHLAVYTAQLGWTPQVQCRTASEMPIHTGLERLGYGRPGGLIMPWAMHPILINASMRDEGTYAGVLAHEVGHSLGELLSEAEQERLVRLTGLPMHGGDEAIRTTSEGIAESHRRCTYPATTGKSDYPVISCDELERSARASGLAVHYSTQR